MVRILGKHNISQELYERRISVVGSIKQAVLSNFGRSCKGKVHLESVRLTVEKTPISNPTRFLLENTSLIKTYARVDMIALQFVQECGVVET